jgi:hypothetical protein
LLITKLESCTKRTAQGTHWPHAETAANRSASKHTSRRIVWDIALCAGASAYVALVLFDDVEGPLISMALIILLAYELVQPHLGNRKLRSIGIRASSSGGT